VSLALYGHPFSSYTWKALIALYANDTPFEFREIGPGAAAQHNAFIHAAHPAGKFPVLADGESIVIEATAIVEHLAVHHRGPAPLLPAAPAAAAVARMLDRVFDNYVMANMQRVVGAYLTNTEVGNNVTLLDQPDLGEVAAGRQGLRRAYDWLERWLAHNALPPHVSLVTCAAAPALFYADWVEPIGNGAPRLAVLRAQLLALPAVSRCIADARPFRSYFPPGAPDRD